jgi:hypothetical protein
MYYPAWWLMFPTKIFRAHKDVTLCFDITFVIKIACFLVTVSRNIRFGTTKRLASRNTNVAVEAMVPVIKLYCQRGVRVKECHGDGKFEPLRADLADVHTTSEEPNIYNFQESTVFSQYTIFFIQ